MLFELDRAIVRREVVIVWVISWTHQTEEDYFQVRYVHTQLRVNKIAEFNQRRYRIGVACQHTTSKAIAFRLLRRRSNESFDLSHEI
ncbi:hypothetical protein D3C86_1877290 [compost metagenome]